MRAHLLRTLRAACLAAAYGALVTLAFYVLIELARFEAATNDAAHWRNVRLELLPKPEEFGWLVGALAFGALALPVLGGRLAWPSRAARAALGALALTLPAMMVGSVIETASWTPVALFATAPLFVALLLTPLPAARERPPPDGLAEPAGA